MIKYKSYTQINEYALHSDQQNEQENETNQV